MTKLKFKVNNKSYIVDINDSERLIDVLRNKLELTSVKEGCGIGECGACTVLMNGEAVNSCLVFAVQCQNSEIITTEYLEQRGSISALQKAFLENGGIQCGFCTPGILMSAKALIDKNPNPNEAEIRDALEGNLCRCTGYIPIINSVKNVK